MHITVQGTHSVRVDPERAELHLAAQVESGSRERALADVTRTANSLAETIAALEGVERHSIDPVRVSSWRPSDQNGRRLAERITARVSLVVEFTDFASLADFTTRVGAQAGVQLGGVAWSVTDATRERLEAEVMAEAVRQARVRATAMADADGGGDLEIVEMADPGLLGGPGAFAAGGHPEMRAMAMGMASDGGSVEIVPEKVEVSASVHVRFLRIPATASARRSQ